MSEGMTIRRRVRAYVEKHAPCTAAAAVEHFDGELTRDQVYSALAQLARGHAGSLPVIGRDGANYVTLPDPADDVPEDLEDLKSITGRPMEGWLEEMDELLTPPPADLRIQNLEEKVATLQMLEKLLAGPIAAKLSLIRADLVRLA